MNTGGPAFPVVRMPLDPDTILNRPGMTLLDWFAGQALEGLLSNQYRKGDVEQYTADAYTWATAMLAEKARREAVVKQSQTTDHSGEANKMVEDHFPDATKMTKLEAQNRELEEKVVELQLWKDTWMKVEAEWSPNELAGLLGGKLGERQRVVIQREVPKLVKDLRDRERERDHANDTASAVLAENNKLVEKVKRLEKAGNEVVYWFSPMAKHQLTPLHLAALNQWNEAKETKP